MPPVKSITGDRLPGEYRILKPDIESAKHGSGPRRACGGRGGEGGGGGGVGRGFEAGQHQVLSGETMVGGSSFRVKTPENPDSE